MTIGKKLKELRETRGYNKSEVAKLLKMPYTTYNNYETDVNDVGSELLKMFSEFYSVSTDFILSVKEDAAVYNAEADPLVKELHTNPELRTLMDASQNLDKEAIDEVTAIVKRIQEQNKE